MKRHTEDREGGVHVMRELLKMGVGATIAVVAILAIAVYAQVSYENAVLLASMHIQ